MKELDEKNYFQNNRVILRRTQFFSELKNFSITIVNLFQIYSQSLHARIETDTDELLHMSAIYSLESLNFDNSFYRELPSDPVIDNNSRYVDAACYSKVSPMLIILFYR